MSKVAIAVKLRVKDGQRDALTAGVHAGLDRAKTEDGTLVYIFHHDAGDANVVWFYELYADQAAFDAHMGSAEFAAWSMSLAPFLDGRPEFTLLTPVGGKGL